MLELLREQGWDVKEMNERWSFFCNGRAQKKPLEFQLVLGTSRSQILLTSPGEVLVCSVDDILTGTLPDPLPIRQVRMKSYLPREKLYLSRTTGRHFFRTLNAWLCEINVLFLS